MTPTTPTKKTPDELAQQRVRKLAEQAAARKEKEDKDAIERAAFMVKLPKLLHDLQIRANDLGVTTFLSLTEAGPEIEFKLNDEVYISDTLSYTSEEWEIVSLAETLERLHGEQVLRAARRQLAKDIWADLTPQEQIAVKNNIDIFS